MSAEQTDNMGMHKLSDTEQRLEDNFQAIDEEFSDRGVNIRWKGADRDGIIDSSEAIKEVFLTGAFSIFIPKGTYLISKNLTIGTDKKIVFGRKARLKPAAGVTITLNCAIDAHLDDWIFDISAGGIINGSMKVNDITPEWFGAKGDGVTDDAPFIQAAVNSHRLGGNKISFNGMKTYKINSELQFMVDRHTIDGHGCTLDCSGIQSGQAIKITSSLTGSNKNEHGIKDLILRGSNRENVIGINMDGSDGKVLNSYYFERINIRDFVTGVRIYSNAYIVKFHSVNIVSPIGVCVYIPAGGTNYGERIVLDDCTLFDSKEGLRNENGSSTVMLNKVSVDYCYRAITITAGRVFAVNCHFECSKNKTDQDNQFYVSGDGGSLHIVASAILMGGNWEKYSIGYVNQTKGNETHYGGLLIDNCSIEVDYNNYNRKFLVDGEGRVLLSNITSYFNGLRGVRIANSLNHLADGSFESSNPLGQWETQYELPIISNTNPKEGKQSVIFQTTLRQQMFVDLPYRVPQKINISYWINIVRLEVGNTLSVTLSYLDSNKNVLSNVRVTHKTIQEWTQIRWQPGPAVPPAGTLFIRLTFDTAGWQQGSEVYLDDVYIYCI
ncbi:hypothetical protein FHS18_000588 [Paenibacillus phyllosphaerae]|uniref:Pectate lyase superfamily protein domain-containing protein n=1 Tax=Paenibacillus phyllosphaerae TaxID=274593 RepID=A0A7W5ATM9_9BACL|nr:hypothetical protein [Paenibacillus phyllosphaerae]MBB3108560.1 hypothetical protein [Paenibacillus phyllosphaerae]